MRQATTKVAAFFDLDKTIIATSSAAAFFKPFLAGGLISRVDALRNAYAHFLFMVGGADAEQTERMRAHLSRLVTGWDVATVQQTVTETLHDYIDPVVYAEAVELIASHHEHGHDVVIVSASGQELVEPIAAMLGADHAVATSMEIKDGKYTGHIDFYAYGDQKAAAITQLAAEQGYDLDASYAYSDSITDAPMLACVGNAFAVNPDRTLRRLAGENGWKILTFTKPVSLRPRTRPATSLIAVSAIVGIAVVAWLAARAARRLTELPSDD